VPTADLELTAAQARVVAALRRLSAPDALVVHPRGWGAIVELRRPRRDGHTYATALASLAPDGTLSPDRAVA